MGLDDQHQQVAQTFGVGPDLLPLLPVLLADLWPLGSWPEKILELLRLFAELPGEVRALDLGCGKGAVAIPLARELGFRVRGIDLFPPFVEEAEARAESAGVADLCRFEVGDIRSVVQTLRDHDVAVLAAVGAGVLGDCERCVGEMRQTVHPGGYLVVDDGFLKAGVDSIRPGYDYYRSHSDTLRELTAHGDRLAGEILVPQGELERCNRWNTERIRRRAQELSRDRPELAASLADYVRSEVEECRFLESETTAAIWLLERC